MSINSLSQGVTMLKYTAAFNIYYYYFFLAKQFYLFQYRCSLVKFKISKIGFMVSDEIRK